MTRMREDLELETLEERRLSLHLILMYKVVEGLVPTQFDTVWQMVPMNYGVHKERMLVLLFLVVW
jgi:hypothetical protein